jgi:LuxR family maltose regulon positive regulatory protein
LIGEPPGPVACEAHVGLARISYQWNDLDAAQQHGQQSVQLARQIDIASVVSSELFLAHLQLAQGNVTGATASLAQTEQTVRQRNFWFRTPEVIAVQVVVQLRNGRVDEAAELAQTHDLPLSLARVRLAQGDTNTALAVLGSLSQQLKEKGWGDERLKVMVFQAVVHHAHDEQDKALQLLSDALALAKPGGYIRLFVDEGASMAHLLAEAAAQGIMPDYTRRLLAAIEAEAPAGERQPDPASPAQSLIEPLSPRELEVLRLIAQGLSNHEIGERLYLALSTVKGHNRVIFGKLGVQRRTEAVARARGLSLL